MAAQLAVVVRRALPDAQRGEMLRPERRRLPLVHRVIRDAVQADLAVRPRLHAGPVDAGGDVLGLARRPRLQVARRAAGAARIHPQADIAVRHPLLGIEQLPVLVLVAGALQHLGRRLDDAEPLALVALLHRQALGIRPVAHDHRILAVRDRAEHVGAQGHAVVHLDRRIPIDFHAVADFGFHHVLFFSGLNANIEAGATKDHVRKRRHHRRRPVGLHAASGAGTDRAALHARRRGGGAERCRHRRDRHPGPGGVVVLARPRHRRRPRLEARPVAALDFAGYQRRLVGDEHARPCAPRRRGRRGRDHPGARRRRHRLGRLRQGRGELQHRDAEAPVAARPRRAERRLCAGRRAPDQDLRPGEVRLRPHRRRAAALGRQESERGLSHAADHGGVSRFADDRRSACAATTACRWWRAPRR